MQESETGSLFVEGDLVEAVKGESVVRGRLNRGTYPTTKEYLYIGDSAAVKEVYIHDGWTVTVIEKATPPLPTEPGAVISWETPFFTGLAVREKDNQWLHDGCTRSDAGMLDTLKGLPFNILEPREVTAKRVLERVKAASISQPGNPTSAWWLSLDSTDIARIATDFGVSE